MLVLGAGCMSTTTTGNTSGTGSDEDVIPGDDSDSDDYTTAACPTGTKRFVSEKENLTFCYPEKVGDETVTIDDVTNSVSLKVNNEVVRVLTVEKVDEDVDRAKKVMSYAANPDDDAIECSAQSVKNEKGRETFILVGTKDDVQGADAVSACSDSTSLHNALNNQPVGMFFFYDNEDELIIVSGSQDAPLGQLTDEFESTIWPQD